MAKYTKIETTTCIACGACSAEAPEVFGEYDDGIAYSLLDENAGVTELDPSLVEDVEFAVDSCPTESVMLQDTPFA
ncbi:MAG: ferredoxin [Mycoplasmatales bacterium]